MSGSDGFDIFNLGGNEFGESFFEGLLRDGFGGSETSGGDGERGFEDGGAEGRSCDEHDDDDGEWWVKDE